MTSIATEDFERTLWESNNYIHFKRDTNEAVTKLLNICLDSFGGSRKATGRIKVMH